MSRQTYSVREQHPIGALPQFASILIVDDQRFDRIRLKKLCRALAFSAHVLEADSLADMRGKLTKERFDLILLDHHLADGTGLEGIALIRADPVNKNAATLMITGTEETDVAGKALELGFSDYLTKDALSQEALTRAVLAALPLTAQGDGSAAIGAQRALVNETLQSFSRECAQDIKPIVSRMMRLMRELREVETLDPQQAKDRIERVEGSLHRLWAFLDELDHLGKTSRREGHSVASRGTNQPSTAPETNIRAAMERPAPKGQKTMRSPSLFRRHPD